MEGKSVEDTSVWDLVYWWSKAELRRMSSLLFKPLLIFLMKCSVSFHVLPLGRPFRRENSWISQVQSSSRCFLAAWGSLGFFDSCNGCGCELTCTKPWSWSPGPPLDWEKVGTEKRTPKAGQAEGCGGGTYWNKALMSRKFLLLWILKGTACTAVLLITIASTNFDARKSEILLRKTLIVVYKLDLKTRNRLCCSCAGRVFSLKPERARESNCFFRNSQNWCYAFCLFYFHILCHTFHSFSLTLTSNLR